MSSSSEPPRVSLVIPNYNGMPFLPRCLPDTLRVFREEVREGECVIVDDASTDGSEGWLAELDPGIRLLRNPGNLGFGATANRGVAAAAGERILLLNADVVLLPGWFAAAGFHFADPGVFAVTFQALDEAGRFREGANRIALKTGLPHTYHDPDDQRRDARGRAVSSYPVGGHCLLRRDRFLELGGFHPLFEPFYWEDADLGLRAWRRGWATIYEPQARVVHLERGSIRRNVDPETIRRVKLRNRFLLAWHAFSPTRLACLHVLPLGVRFLAAALTLDRAFFQAFAAAVRRWRRGVS